MLGQLWIQHCHWYTHITLKQPVDGSKMAKLMKKLSLCMECIINLNDLRKNTFIQGQNTAVLLRELQLHFKKQTNKTTIMYYHRQFNTAHFQMYLSNWLNLRYYPPLSSPAPSSNFLFLAFCYWENISRLLDDLLNRSFKK